MKFYFFLLAFIPAVVFSQKKIVVEGSPSNYYINHTTGPKENFYSIGRIYNISPRVFAPYNNLEMEKGLSIGQVVKIPLTEINFSPSGEALEDEVIVPLFNKSQKQIGYLRVKKELSSLAANGTFPKSIIKSETQVAVVPAPEPKSQPVKVQEEIKKDPPVAYTQPVVKQEAEPVAQTSSSNINNKSEYFSKAFSSQIIKTNFIPATGTTFKSNSGWKDGKYYCFHNVADAGSIVKITNANNGKSVYAKVLDVIPDLPANSGINILISDAAANELGVSNNFNCKLSY